MAVEYSATDHHLAVCYSTSPYGSSFEIAGGQITVDALNTQSTYSNPGGNTVDANCNPDSGAGVSPNCGLAATPTYQVNGDTVSFQIFFAACFGACPVIQSQGVAQTGVVLGTLVPCSSGGTVGACYQLSQAEVLVNGVPVVDQYSPPVGAGANPFSQLYENLYGSSNGPCVDGECLPIDGYIETTGVPWWSLSSPRLARSVWVRPRSACTTTAQPAREMTARRQHVVRFVAMLALATLVAGCGGGQALARPSEGGRPTPSPLLFSSSPSASVTTAGATGTPAPTLDGQGSTPTVANSTPGRPAGGGGGGDGGNSGGGSQTPPPTLGAGSCPDPRYCADYNLLGGKWQSDGAGNVNIPYWINPAGTTSTTLSTGQIISIIQLAAQTVMDADPRLHFVYQGTSTSQPTGWNDVVGFIPEGGGVNITQNGSATYTGFNIQFDPTAPWVWEGCDPPSQPCSPYKGTGLDLQAIATHAWGHVPGLGDVGAFQDRYLSNYGGIGAEAGCGAGSGYVCRFADTQGVGDILGIRELYPTSAPMPTIYDDTDSP